MSDTQQKLKNSTIKHIESEIELLHETKREIERFLSDDYTEQFSLLRSDDKILAFHNRQIYSMGVITEAIENSYQYLSDDHKNVIKARYWNKRKLTWDGIALELNMHRNTALKYRNEFIELIAAKLGWT